MPEGLTVWETTRLSKHFILLDFLADHEVYQPRGGTAPHWEIMLGQLDAGDADTRWHALHSSARAQGDR